MGIYLGSFETYATISLEKCIQLLKNLQPTLNSEMYGLKFKHKVHYETSFEREDSKNYLVKMVFSQSLAASIKAKGRLANEEGRITVSLFYYLTWKTLAYYIFQLALATILIFLGRYSIVFAYGGILSFVLAIALYSHHVYRLLQCAKLSIDESFVDL